MTLLLFLAISAAGGIGAGARLLLDGVLRARSKVAFPIGTTVINVTGSLALGIATGAAIHGILSEPWHLVIGTGFLGGYTTFSTASFETVRLIQQRRGVLALASSIGLLSLAIAAATGGLLFGVLI